MGSGVFATVVAGEWKIPCAVKKMKQYLPCQCIRLLANISWQVILVSDADRLLETFVKVGCLKAKDPAQVQ